MKARQRSGGSGILAEGQDEIELTDTVRLPLDVVTATIAVLANRGGGKSAFTHLLVERMHVAGLPVVVLDVKGDWWGIRSSADGSGPGLPFVIFGGDRGDVALEPTAGELLADLIVDERIPAVLDMSHMSKTAARSFATAFAERLYRRNRDPLHVVIEEADVLVPQRASAETARLLGAMEDLAKRGRHRGLGMTLVSQRGQEVAKSVLDLMETVVLLRMTGPRSIKAVQEWISVNADQDAVTAREVIASLPTLETGEGWVWSPGFLRMLTRARFPLFSTFDSHATPKPGQVRVVPAARADIDLDRLGREIAATRERARDNDPRALRSRLEELSRQVAEADERVAAARAAEARMVQELAARDREVADLRSRVAYLEASGVPNVQSMESLRSAINLIGTAIDDLSAGQRPAPMAPRITVRPKGAQQRPAAQETAPGVSGPTVPAAARSVASERATGAVEDERLQFRKGALRMLTSLARMAPLRLTKAQWAMVAQIKHTGGTWSTYLGELRRACLLDEGPGGFTLSQAGWDYLGVRPEPMTARELQEHYLAILRAGAGRMLQACIDAYPYGLTRDELARAAEVVASGGTFSTYLGELRRNGLVTQAGDTITATDVLMHGANSGSGGPVNADDSAVSHP